MFTREHLKPMRSSGDKHHLSGKEFEKEFIAADKLYRAAKQHKLMAYVEMAEHFVFTKMYLI